MPSCLAPPALTTALRGRGLDLVGPIGSGAGGARWTATDADGTRWVVVGTAPGRASELLRARVEALAAVQHPHLARVGPLLTLEDGGAVGLLEAAPGLDLEVLLSARGALRPAEVVTLLVPAAGALAALHGAGLAHGDVSAANVVVGPRPAVLVDLLEGGGSTEGGTPGFASPERAHGPSAPDDVYALARIGLALLGPPRAADTSAEAVRACLEAVVSADRTGRPGAAELALRLYDACPPEPVELPAPDVLAHLALRRLARDSGAGTARRTGSRARTVGRASRGRHRARRRGHVAALGLGALVAAAGLGLAGSHLVGARAQAVDRGLSTSPAMAATLASRDRAQALAAGSPALLAAVTLPGSPAAHADATLLARLRRGGGLPLDVRTTVVARTGSAGQCAVAGAGSPVTTPISLGSASCAVVALRTWVGAAVAPTTTQVVLVMRATAGGWRVEAVRAVGS